VHQGLQLRTAHLQEFWRPLRYNSPDCPVALRTVRCASGATTTSRQRSSAERIECATVRARVRVELDGTPDTEQCLSGAPPDCPVAQKTEAPTVGIQRPGDYKYPQPPTIHCIQVFQLPTPYKSYSIQYKTHQRDQILSQVHNSFQIK
jgi:hypothetical protein